jgi:hypothetical protein
VGVPARGPAAELDLGDVRRRADYGLAYQEPGREFEVITGGAHGHGQRGAVHPDPERLLAREKVGMGRAVTRPAVAEQRNPQHTPPCRPPGQQPAFRIAFLPKGYACGKLRTTAVARHVLAAIFGC